MAILELLNNTAHYLAEFKLIDQKWTEPHRRHAYIYQDLNLEDILFNRNTIIKKIQTDIRHKRYSYYQYS